MPVITWLVIDQYRCLSGRVGDVAEWRICQRHPAHEVRVRLERIIVVIEKHADRRTGENHHVIGTGPLERPVVARLQGADMLRVWPCQRGAVVIIHACIITAEFPIRERHKRFNSTHYLGIIRGRPGAAGRTI